MRKIIAGDIGATKTSLAVFSIEDGKPELIKQAKFISKDYPSVAEMLTVFLEKKFPAACISLGVAGPVQEGKVKITNLAKKIDAGQLSGQFDNIPVFLLNDLEATAYGLPLLHRDQLYTLHEPSYTTPGNIAVISPGTGLGEAGLYWSGHSHHPFATEGGHTDFSPRNDLNIELFHFLQQKFGHVSWERVVSGQGIVNIFDFLVNKKQRDAPEWLRMSVDNSQLPALISGNAESIDICAETMQLFIRYLATATANLALTLKAGGGVYIAGGIAPKIIKLIDKDFFLQCFANSGRMNGLLLTMPVSIILNEDLPLLGAAYYGISQLSKIS